MILIPLNLSGLSLPILHCLGRIASTELDLSFSLRVFICCQNCFGLFVKVSSFFNILFAFHFCFLDLGCIFVLLLKILILVNDVYVFQIFFKRLAICLSSFFRLAQVSLYEGLLVFLFVLHRHFNFKLLLAQFVMNSVNALFACTS